MKLSRSHDTLDGEPRVHSDASSMRRQSSALDPGPAVRDTCPERVALLLCSHPGCARLLDQNMGGEPQVQSRSFDSRIRRVLAWREHLLRVALAASGVAHIAGGVIYALSGGGLNAVLVLAPIAFGLLHLVLRVASAWLRLAPLLFIGSIGVELGVLGAFAAWSPSVALLALFGTVYAGLLLGRTGAVALPVAVCLWLVTGAIAVQWGWPYSLAVDLDDPVNWLRVGVMFAALTGIVALSLRQLLQTLDLLGQEAAAVLRESEQEAARTEHARGRRMTTEAAVQDAQKLQTVAQLSGGLAHRLNNTLTIVRSAAEQLAESRSVAEIHAVVATVAQSIRRAAMTTWGLLAFSRRGQPEARPVDLKKQVTEFWETLEDAVPGNIVLERRLQTTPDIQADACRIQQITLTLVLNACDAIEGKGAIVVETGLQSVTQQTADRMCLPVVPGDYATLSVADTGEGMEPEVAQLACEPFFSTRDSQKREGLGLFVASGLLKQWGGSLSIQSTKGQGTTVTVFLPLAPDPRGAPLASAKPERHSATRRASLAVRRRLEAPVDPGPVATSQEAGRTSLPSSDAWKLLSLDRALALVALAFGVVLVSNLLMLRVKDLASIGSAAMGFVLTAAAWRLRRLPMGVRLGIALSCIYVSTTATLLRSYMSPTVIVGHATIVLLATVFASSRASWVALGATLLVFVVAAQRPIAGDWRTANLDVLLSDNWLRHAITLPAVLIVTASTVLDVLRTAMRSLERFEVSLQRLLQARDERETEIRTLTTVEHVAARAARLEAMGRVAGAIAHDLNNALAGILGWATLLADQAEPAPEDVRDAIVDFREAADFAAALVMQLQPRDPIGPGRGSACDAGEVITRSKVILQRLACERVDVTIDVEDGCFVPIAATELRRILMNLAANARDAMPEGGRFSVRARQISGDVVLEVEDTGVGMDEATQGRVFEAFFTTKGKHEGTGLGLNTVAHLVDSTGGSIELRSAKGQGTRLALRWPRAEAPAPAVPAALATNTEQCGVVLLAEDNEWVRRAMARGLERSGCEVVAAADGTEALAAMSQRDDWLALCTDAIMPGDSSALVIERFRQSFPERPIVLCSGHLPREVEGIAASGNVRFLQKPFAPSELVAALQEELGQGFEERHAALREALSSPTALTTGP